jgi:hypothetical protein
MKHPRNQHAARGGGACLVVPSAAPELANVAAAEATVLIESGSVQSRRAVCAEFIDPIG